MYGNVHEKNNTLNCWEPLKLTVPQRKDEKPKRDGYESRKKTVRWCKVKS